MKTKDKIKLGDEAKDMITGFTGIVICITKWINGCKRITIQPQTLHEGKPLDAITFDVEVMVRTKANAVPLKVKPTGGPSIPPAARKDPR